MKAVFRVDVMSAIAGGVAKTQGGAPVEKPAKLPACLRRLSNDLAFFLFHIFFHCIAVARRKHESCKRAGWISLGGRVYGDEFLWLSSDYDGGHDGNG